MKVRNGFVSNSSSSSFVISLDALNPLQVFAIKGHSTMCEIVNMKCDGDAWYIDIDEDEKTVEGRTTMDNFDMEEYLSKIGVPSHVINWDY